MENKNLKIQSIVLFLLILANFIAQVPYSLHLYYNPNNLLAQAKGISMMLFVFVVFLLAAIFFFRRTVAGYWSLVLFLTVEFLFYLWNTIGEVVHGYSLFFHLADPDMLLKIVFAVGSVTLFASGYFLALLLWKRKSFLPAENESLEAPFTKR